MDDIQDLERRLSAARKAVANCLSCRGAGWFDDTTYDRCGVVVKCRVCHGSGLPEDKVQQIIDAAFLMSMKPKPIDKKEGG